jgi:Zn-finger nucleic acid-binding protein
MNCVACKEPMIVLELDQIEIDHCLECGGIWLDSGELESLLENPQKAEEFIAKAGEAGKSQKTKRKCPICSKRMLEIAVGSDRLVYIDRCPDNHGLWFDRGELEDVIKILEGDDGGKVVNLLREMFGK